MSIILVTSLVSAKNQTPRVDITINSQRVQLSADEAMNFAKQVIEVSQGAYADAFLYHWLLEKVFKGEIEGNENALGQLLVDFRDYRDELYKEFLNYQEEAKNDTE